MYEGMSKFGMPSCIMGGLSHLIKKVQNVSKLTLLLTS